MRTVRDGLGAESREGKRSGLTRSELRAAWDVRLTAEEKAMVFKTFDRPAGAKPAFFGQFEIPGFAFVPVQALQWVADFRGIIPRHPRPHDKAEFLVR